MKARRILDPYFDDASTREEEIAVARSLPRGALVDAVLSHSWDVWYETTMAAIADRDDCPLLAALFIIDLGDPDHVAARAREDAEGPDAEMLALFKRIEARINAGGYTHMPEDHLATDAPAVEAYLAGAGHEVLALDPAIVRRALKRPTRDTATLSEVEEKAAQEIYAGIKAAAAQGETAVKAQALRATAYDRRVDDRILELAAADRPKRRWTLSAILWVFIPWSLFFLLFWSDVKRIAGYF